MSIGPPPPPPPSQTVAENVFDNPLARHPDTGEAVRSPEKAGDILKFPGRPPVPAMSGYVSGAGMHRGGSAGIKPSAAAAAPRGARPASAAAPAERPSKEPATMTGYSHVEVQNRRRQQMRENLFAAREARLLAGGGKLSFGCAP